MKFRLFLFLAFWSLFLTISAGSVDVKDMSSAGSGESRLVNNLAIHSSGSLVTLTWNAVPHAGFYKVYSSANRNSGFTNDLSGTFNGTSWTTSTSYGHRYYYVTSVTTTLFIEAFNDYGAPLNAYVKLNYGDIGMTPLIIENYSPGLYFLFYADYYGTYIWDPWEVQIDDNTIDRHLVFIGFNWLLESE